MRAKAELNFTLTGKTKLYFEYNFALYDFAKKTAITT